MSTRTRPSLTVNVTWTLLGNVVFGGCQWLTIVATARLGTVEMVGQYALALAVIAPLTKILNLGLRGIQATDAAYEMGDADYTKARLLTSPFIPLAAVLVSTLLPGLRSIRMIILAAGMAKAAEAVSDIAYGALQRAETMQTVSKSLILRGLLGLTAFATALHATANLAVAVLSLALAWTAVMLAVDLPSARKHSEPEWKAFSGTSTFRRILRVGLPLGITGLVTALNVAVPKYFVEALLDTEALGIYAALAYVPMLGGMIVNSIGQAVSPRLSVEAHLGNGRRVTSFLVRLVLLAAGLGLFGFLIASTFGDQILGLLYGPEFAGYAEVFAMFMAASGILYAASFLGYGLTALRELRIQPVMFMAVLAVTIGLHAAFVPLWDLTGAIMAYAGAALVQLFLSGLLVARKLRGKW